MIIEKEPSEGFATGCPYFEKKFINMVVNRFPVYSRTCKLNLQGLDCACLAKHNFEEKDKDKKKKLKWNGQTWEKID